MSIPKSIIRLSSPPPPLNNCYANVPGKGRVKSRRLREWQNAVGWDLLRSKPHKWTEPVYITIAVGKIPANSDLDGRLKAVLDLLVTHQVIPDDNISIVRGINAYMAQIPFDGVEVAITAADTATVAA